LLLAVERRGHRRIATVSATIALALIALLAVAAHAQAAELVYWDNYGDDPDTVGFANIDGSGGGTLPLGGQELEDPEGMAYDTVTNRLFVTSDNDKIIAINLDGSGATAFSAPGAPIKDPEGITLDPATRTIYWANVDDDTISWAKLDGSAGGTLNTSGATVNGFCCRLAIDPVAGRVYWVNTSATPNVLSYAKVDNSGGGDLSYAGSSVEPSSEGLAVDPAAGRIYYLTGDEIGFANLNGSGGGTVSTAGGIFNGPWGFAFDPVIGRFYWGNENNGEDEREDAIGFLNLAGGGGGIDIASTSVDNPQDPIIIKSPAGTGAPAIARDAKVRSALTCSSGSWGADFAGSFVYRAPRSLAYQWTLNGTVLGSGPETITATAAGAYACTVTATNQAGSATQTSVPVSVTATNVKLTTKKKGKGEPGDRITFKVKAVNQGDIETRNSTKVCVKLPKTSKADLKAPKCKKLGPLQGGAKKTLRLKIKVKPGADEGTAKLTFQVKGSTGKAAKSKIIVK
jgi:hypothetical protein